MNKELIKKAKNDFERDAFKLMNNAMFEKTMENVRTRGDIKLVRAKEKRNSLVSEPKYHTPKFSSENLLAIEIKHKYS